MKKIATALLVLTFLVSLMACGVQSVYADSAKVSDVMERTEEALLEAWGKKQLEDGHVSFWTIEERYEFYRPWVEMLQQLPDKNSIGLLCGLPDEHDIQQEEAHDLAVVALQEEYGEDVFNDGRIWDRESVYFFVYETGEHEWQFTLFSKKANSIFESFPYYDVCIDAKTGEPTRVAMHTEMIEDNDVDIAEMIEKNEYDMLDIADMIQVGLIDIASLSYMLEENIIDMDDITLMVKANAIDIGDLFEANVIDLADISYMITKRASDMLVIHDLIRAGVIDLVEYADVSGANADDIAEMMAYDEFGSIEKTEN